MGLGLPTFRDLGQLLHGARQPGRRGLGGFLGGHVGGYESLLQTRQMDS